MRIICIDADSLALERILGQCRMLPQAGEVRGFTDAHAALGYLEGHSADLAVLDMDMPGVDGVALAVRIKELRPRASILFLAAHRDHAFEAYAAHPSGYLLKPVSQEKLAAEVAYASGIAVLPQQAHIRIQTFGNFDVYVDGMPVAFKLAKAKEILAYLVDKQGTGVTRKELFAAIWEDRPYDRKMQKQLDVYIRSLRDSLREYGIEGVMEMERGVLRVKPDLFTCDSYLLQSGAGEALDAFRGEYMNAYSWASLTEGSLFWGPSHR